MLSISRKTRKKGLTCLSPKAAPPGRDSGQKARILPKRAVVAPQLGTRGTGRAARGGRGATGSRSGGTLRRSPGVASVRCAAEDVCPGHRRQVRVPFAVEEELVPDT